MIEQLDVPALGAVMVTVKVPGLERDLFLQATFYSGDETLNRLKALAPYVGPLPEKVDETGRKELEFRKVLADLLGGGE